MKNARVLLVLFMTLLAPSLVSAGNAEKPKGGAKNGRKLAPPHVVPRHFLRAPGPRIESGLRIESSAERVRVARKVFPQGGEPRGLSLPPHLGGGFLFFQPVAVDGSTYTAFYRSKTWTGELSPLGRIPFAVQHVALGFDRIYALGVSLRAALDLDSGQMLSLAPLPPLATITGLSFDGPRRALVSGPLVGVLYTRDAGLTWTHVRGAESIEVDLAGSHLFVRTSSGLSLVNDEGDAVLVHDANLDQGSLRTLDFERVLDGQSGEDFLGMMAPADGRKLGTDLGAPSRDLLERQWLSVVTRGAPHKGAAFAIDGGELLKLGLDEGLELRSYPSEVARTSTCIATVDESKKQLSPLFLCRGATLQTYRLAPDGRGKRDAAPTLDLVWEGSSEREVLTWGNGGVLLSGACGARKSTFEVCHLNTAGARSLRLPMRKLGREPSPAYATTSHGAEVAWFDRTTNTIKRALLSAPDTPPKKPQSFALPSDHSIAELIKAGAVLPRASVTKEGLNLWATHREQFVGVLLGDGETPSFGVVQRPLRRALFDGPRALLWGAAGFAKQSVDGGQTFEELSLPYRSGDAELAVVDHGRAAVTMGCTAVGCSLGRLLKLGWTAPKQTEEKIPEAHPFPVSGLTRFRFTCGGLVSSPSRRASEADSFPNFWEKRSPTLPAGYDGSSVAFPGDLARFYASGPADTSWSRAGRSEILFVDPWDGLAVRATAPTQKLFLSAADAKTRLGLADPTSGFRFLSMDPDGRGGVMIFRGAATTELFVFEEGQPIEPFSGAHELGHRNLAGAVRSRASFVASFVHGPTFSLVRLSGGRVHPFVDFNLGTNGQRAVQLVRTQRGDLGIALEGDDALFVYPVSDQGELGRPIVVPHESSTPPGCSPEATGYIIDRELAVAPYMETTTSRAIPVSRVRAQVIVGYGKICINSLRAEARDLGDISGARAPTASIPLSIFDADSDGQRSQLICE